MSARFVISCSTRNQISLHTLNMCISHHFRPLSTVNHFQKKDDRKRAKSFFKPAEYRRNSAVLNGLCPFCPTKLKEINCLDEHVLDFHKPLLLACDRSNKTDRNCPTNQ
ncbi:uncharacterized protein LOC111042497 [Myzus persicae]|uniref:uncharacterized protein LOC111042497 n=1 Tax=Myzus persicae TaxID=13164 RepID=UPI000B934ECB|nr:uncharacterized protein LOC111042497 [Myzus persicae]